MPIMNQGFQALLNNWAQDNINAVSVVQGPIGQDPTDNSVGTVEESDSSPTTRIERRLIQITGRFRGDSLSNPGTEQEHAIVDIGGDASLGYTFSPLTFNANKDVVIVFSTPTEVKQ